MPVQSFYDKNTSTLSYIVYSENQKECIVIDPVLNFEAATGTIHFNEIHLYKDFLAKHNLTPTLCLETHVHADHMSGAQFLKQLYPNLKVAISERVLEVQAHFSEYFNISCAAKGADFDLLLKDNETYTQGDLDFTVLATPGHTPACSSFLFDGYVFTGDALFMPDIGTGRCDFPGGDAKTLYKSITEKIYSLEGQTLTYTGHDYPPEGRELKFCSTVSEHKKSNAHVTESTSEKDFIAFRQKRDSGLNPPRLLIPSIQVNILGGKLPEKTVNDWCFLKLPVHIVDEI